MEEKLNITFANKWLADLKKYWFNKDIEKSVALFKNTEFYQETPFMEPYTKFEEIKKEWQHITDENIKRIEFKILAIEEHTLIVEWFLEQNEEIYDGVYEIKFNNNLECIYFKSWEMVK